MFRITTFTASMNFLRFSQHSQSNQTGSSGPFLLCSRLKTHRACADMPTALLLAAWTINERTQNASYIAHNMFGQIKVEIPWYINRHTLISRKMDGKPRMIGGQFVVVRVGVHQLSISPNTSHPILQICSKLLHSNSMPSLNS